MTPTNCTTCYRPIAHAADAIEVVTETSRARYHTWCAPKTPRAAKSLPVVVPSGYQRATKVRQYYFLADATKDALVLDVLDVLSRSRLHAVTIHSGGVGGTDHRFGAVPVSDLLKILRGSLRGSMSLKSARRWRGMPVLAEFTRQIERLGFRVALDRNERGNRGHFVSLNLSSTNAESDMRRVLGLLYGLGRSGGGVAL